MCVMHIKVRSIVHMTVEFHGVCCHKYNHKVLMKEVRVGGTENFSQTHHFLCAAVALIFSILKNQTKRQAIELLFKSARTTLRLTQIRVVFLCPYPFCELCSSFNGISLYKLFAIFLPDQMEIFISYLSY